MKPARELPKEGLKERWNGSNGERGRRKYGFRNWGSQVIPCSVKPLQWTAARIPT
jgi:hypothetical protein